MNPLDRRASSAEATMLDLVYEAYEDHGQWPIYQYVDSTLYNRFGGLDAQTILLGCPRVSIGPSKIGHYGWFRSSNPTLSAQQPADEISITVAEMAQLPQASRIVGMFMRTLAYLINRERSAKPSPLAVDEVTVTSEEVGLELIMGLQRLDPGLLKLMGSILQHEPSTWGCRIEVSGDGTWTAHPDAFLRQYEGVTGIDDYLDRLVQQIAPESAPRDGLADQVSHSVSKRGFNFFISHASEDKDAIARPLYQEFRDRGYKVWFDEAELKVGQSLVESIDQGLANCDHGIVILSSAFFGKKWPERELAGLVQRAMSGEEQVILPVWHGVSQEDVRSYSLPLADIVAVKSEMGIAAVANALISGLGT